MMSKVCSSRGHGGKNLSTKGSLWEKTTPFSEAGKTVRLPLHKTAAHLCWELWRTVYNPSQFSCLRDQEAGISILPISISHWQRTAPKRSICLALPSCPMYMSLGKALVQRVTDACRWMSLTSARPVSVKKVWMGLQQCHFYTVMLWNGLIN